MPQASAVRPGGFAGPVAVGPGFGLSPRADTRSG